MARLTTSLRPPLRWAGSKRRLVPELCLAAPVQFVRYVEPFAGSACLFFALRPQTAILNDLNRELVDFYRMLRAHPRLIAKRTLSLPDTAEFYYELRQTSAESLPAIDRAARFLYLNRHCFNGVYRTNRLGVFNVPRGIHTGSIPSETDLYRCSLLLRNALLSAGDFEAVLQDVGPGDFVYLDPPYTAIDRKAYGEYGYGSFSEVDQERLLHALRRADAKGATIILSYRYDPSMASSLDGWHYKQVLVRRHVAGFAGSRKLFAEMLLANFRLPEG